MKCEQIEININSSTRGFHLITDIIQSNIPQMTNYKIGLLNLFLNFLILAEIILVVFDISTSRDFYKYLAHFLSLD